MNIDVKICETKSSAASCHRVCIEICKDEHIRWQRVHNTEFCEKFKHENVQILKKIQRMVFQSFCCFCMFVVSFATLLVRIFRGEKVPTQSGSYREYLMSIGFAGFHSVSCVYLFILAYIGFTEYIFGFTVLLILSFVYWFNWFILVLLSISLVLLVFN